MAYLYFSTITTSSFKVRVSGLDTNYNQGGRWITFELYKGSSYLDYYTITLANRVSSSSYVTFSGLSANTLYTVDATIGGIVGSSNVYLSDTVRTDTLAIPSTPTPSVYDYSYTWIDFDWTSSTGADGYDYQLVQGTTLIEYGSTTRNYKLFSNLSPGTQYGLRVLAYNSSGDSAWSSYLYRTTQYLYYPSFSLYDSGETDFAINIYNEPDVDSYKIYVDGAYYGSLARNSNTGYQTYIISGLTMGRSYSIRTSSVVDGVESSLSPTQVFETNYPYPTTSVDSVTNNAATISWTSVTGATRYYIYLNGVSQGYVTNRTYTFTGLSPLTIYSFYVAAYNGYVDSNTTLIIDSFTTTDKVRPSNWSWEYTIASGQPFYTQSGTSVFIMRAAHWNAFTFRINEFRTYKGYATYGFTQAITSHTEAQIKTCINQAIAAINIMGFSQPQVASGDTVAASTFITMRDNLNSIT